MNVKVEVLDTTRRKNAYDGVEPADYAAKIKVPMGRLDYAFSISEIVHQPFSKLKAILGDAAFDKIVENQGYKIPKGEWGTFVREDNLVDLLFLHSAPTKSPMQSNSCLSAGENTNRDATSRIVKAFTASPALPSNPLFKIV